MEDGDWKIKDNLGIKDWGWMVSDGWILRIFNIN
jgi:hypothetical protein